MPLGTVFIDPDLLAGPAAAPEASHTTSLDLPGPLRHLRQAGHRVVPLRAERAGQPDGAPGRSAAVLASIPDQGEGWLLSDDPAVCSGARRRRLRTILVGPAVRLPSLAQRAADMEARDLMEAALLILADEAMPGSRLARSPTADRIPLHQK